MQTYDEVSITKGHPWVPQESQDYVLRSPKRQTQLLADKFWNFDCLLLSRNSVF